MSQLQAQFEIDCILVVMTVVEIVCCSYNYYVIN